MADDLEPGAGCFSLAFDLQNARKVSERVRRDACRQRRGARKGDGPFLPERKLEQLDPPRQVRLEVVRRATLALEQGDPSLQAMESWATSRSAKACLVQGGSRRPSTGPPCQAGPRVLPSSPRRSTVRAGPRWKALGSSLDHKAMRPGCRGSSLQRRTTSDVGLPAQHLVRRRPQSVVLSQAGAMAPSRARRRRQHLDCTRRR